MTFPRTESNASIHEVFNKRTHLVNDSILNKFKQRFTNDFDFSHSNKKLQILISRIKKWIKLLERHMKTMPNSYLLEEKCRYLAQFSRKMIAIALPGEFLLPKLDSISIARFMPRVEIVSKHNCYTRRLNIRGQNGKIYPYLGKNTLKFFTLIFNSFSFKLSSTTMALIFVEKKDSFNCSVFLTFTFSNTKKLLVVF